jgi:hypothetical protein
MNIILAFQIYLKYKIKYVLKRDENLLISK